MDEEKVKVENKNSLIKLVFKALIIFFAFEVISQIVGSLLARGFWQTLMYGKYSTSFIAEITVLFLALILLVLRKKWYIFKNAKKDFFTSIKMGGPILVIAIIFFFLNAISLVNVDFSYSNLASLILFAFAVGLFEEVFYRGIIQNEIIKNYSSNRREVIISLIISSIIFGLVHLTNVFYGQTIFETLVQVFQTAAVGLILGSVYYLTENIWAVAFLHGFYDFSILLGDVPYYKDCTYLENLPQIAVFTSISISIILIIIYLVHSYSLLQKSKINPLLNESVSEELILEDKKKVNLLNKSYFFLVIAYIAISIIGGTLDSGEEYYICYNYEPLKVSNFETHYYNYHSFNINDLTSNGEIVNLDISLNEGRVKITNSFLGITKTLDYEEVLSLVVYEYNDKYQILILATSDYVNYKIYYSNFISKENINNSSEYLENIIASFNSYDVPEANTIGYLKDADTGIIYPLIRTTIFDLFVINNNAVYVIE